MITDDELDRWQALCDDATPGPWEFIVAARTALPMLIAEVRRLRAMEKEKADVDKGAF